MKWYYAKGGSQQGPVSTEDLQAKISSGELAPSDLIWRDGMKDWLPVSQVGDFGSHVPSAEASQPAAGGASPTAESPYQAPVSPTAAPGAAAPVGSGKATAALVLGILAVVFGLCGCYGIMISLPCGIIAIVMGNGARKDIAMNPALQSEEGKAKTGVLLGWIGLGLGIVFTIAIFALGFGSAMMEGGM
jgi:hypothetical protein